MDRSACKGGQSEQSSRGGSSTSRVAAGLGTRRNISAGLTPRLVLRARLSPSVRGTPQNYSPLTPTNPLNPQTIDNTQLTRERSTNVDSLHLLFIHHNKIRILTGLQ